MNEIIVFAVYLVAIFAVMAIGCAIAFLLEHSRICNWLYKKIYPTKRHSPLPCDFHCRYYGTELDGDHYIAVCRKHGTDIDRGREICFGKRSK